MQSSYSLRNITTRTTYANGNTVTAGPPVNGTYPLGLFREDYEYIANAAPEYLDEHNGRYCETPEYPNGTYAYFCTVDENWNSAYPYAVGPTFYGVKNAVKVPSITEAVTTYIPTEDTTGTGIVTQDFDNLKVSLFPNPANDLLAIQYNGLLKETIKVQMFDISGKLIIETAINQGSTIAYMDISTVYNGMYLMQLSNNEFTSVQKVLIQR